MADNSLDYDWLVQEIEELQDDISNLEEELARADRKKDRAETKATVMSNKYHLLEGSIEGKITERNQQLVEKCLIFTDLIEEYERVRQVYAKHCDVRLTANKLNELRSKGGYLPI